jgi:membrane protein DedA with SNARE-associated domain
VLFLLARTAGRSLLASNLERAKQNERAAAALRVLGSNVGTLIVCGRFVPGLRFVVNATMGMSELPFRRFLFWVTVGGTFWSVYTCGVTYLVGQALGDYPLVSFATSAIASTILLGLVAIPLKRQYERERDAERLTG